MVIVLSIVTVIFYIIPMRYIFLAWGIKKFTRKIIKPNHIPNNELMDFLSRIPSDEELVRYNFVFTWLLNIILLIVFIDWINLFLINYMHIILRHLVTLFLILPDSCYYGMSMMRIRKRNVNKVIIIESPL